jgi:hypothetical protein
MDGTGEGRTSATASCAAEGRLRRLDVRPDRFCPVPRPGIAPRLKPVIAGFGRVAYGIPRSGPGAGGGALPRRCPRSPLSKTVFCTAENSTFCRFCAILLVVYIVSHISYLCRNAVYFVNLILNNNTHINIPANKYLTRRS